MGIAGDCKEWFKPHIKIVPRDQLTHNICVHDASQLMKRIPKSLNCGKDLAKVVLNMITPHACMGIVLVCDNYAKMPKPRAWTNCKRGKTEASTKERSAKRMRLRTEHAHIDMEQADVPLEDLIEVDSDRLLRELMVHIREEKLNTKPILILSSGTWGEIWDEDFATAYIGVDHDQDFQDIARIVFESCLWRQTGEADLRMAQVVLALQSPDIRGYDVPRDARLRNMRIPIGQDWSTSSDSFTTDCHVSLYAFKCAVDACRSPLAKNLTFAINSCDWDMIFIFLLCGLCSNVEIVQPIFGDRSNRRVISMTSLAMATANPVALTLLAVMTGGDYCPALPGCAVQSGEYKKQVPAISRHMQHAVVCLRAKGYPSKKNKSKVLASALVLLVDRQQLATAIACHAGGFRKIKPKDAAMTPQLYINQSVACACWTVLYFLTALGFHCPPITGIFCEKGYPLPRCQLQMLGDDCDQVHVLSKTSDKARAKLQGYLYVKTDEI